MRLVLPPNKILYSPCREVTNIDEEVRPWIPQLIQAMRREGGVGISANQIGMDRRVFITNMPDDYIRIFINPVVELRGDIIETEEGCLSYPDLRFKRKRHEHCTVHALSLNNKQFILDTRDIHTYQRPSLAVCIQHEMDHMEGRDVREEMQ